MTNIVINGHELKVIVMNDNRTREKIVSQVQDILLQEKVNASLSLSGLEKMFRGEAPRNRPAQVLKALAEVLGVPVSNFAEFETKAAS